jgi:glyoxylase I family protein
VAGTAAYLGPGIPFSDYGVWSIERWDQIFLTDPAGNTIEIHQILD